MTTALIDADVLTYTVGFAAQTTIWQVRDDDNLLFESEKKNDCLTFIEDAGVALDLTSRVEPDKLENALHTVKQMIKKIQAASGASRYRPYLTGKGNFREKIATIRKYKGNRIAEKPYHYQNIRDYLVDHHKAIVVDGMEADDAIAIVHTKALREKRRTVICSIDKDFDQIVGYHYYFKKDKEEFYEVSPSEAIHSFYKQVLTGDTVDNIPGLPGIGPQKAEKVLSGCRTRGEYEKAVLEAYRGHYGDVHDYHYWYDEAKKVQVSATPEALMLENARLLYLLREAPKDGMIKLWRPLWLDKDETVSVRRHSDATDLA